MRVAEQPAVGVWIDAFRWMAAASVLLTHIAIRMLPPYDGALPAWQQAYLFLAGFDHPAVLVFFVLSGWLVGGAVWREVAQTGRFRWRRYALRRGVRLCVVLWPALGLAGLCVAAGAPPGDHSLGALLCNMAFLQTAACPQYAGNGALWSLFNEAWYYAVFPALALAWAPGRSRAARVALAAAALGILAALTAAQFTGAALAPYLAVWLLGVWASVLPRAPLAPLQSAILLAACLLAVRLLVRRSFAAAHPAGAFALDLAVAGCFALLLASLTRARIVPPWPALHASLAGFSFSLYCTHIPLLGVVITILRRAGRNPADPSAVAAAWLACGAAAWAFARITEAHTATVRGWLTRRRIRAGA